MKMIKHELIRAFENKNFKISFLFSVFLGMAHYIMAALPYRRYLSDALDYPEMFILPHSSFSMWMGFDGFNQHLQLFYLVAPLLACFPFSSSLFTDLKNGYAKNILCHTNRMSYCISKFIAVFLSAGFISIVSLGVNFLLTSATFPYIGPLAGTGTIPISAACIFSELFYSAPYQYLLVFLLINFVFFGALASISLIISIFARHVYSVGICPFLLYFIDYLISKLLHLEKYAPFYFLQPYQPVHNGNAIFVILFPIILLILSFGIFIGLSRNLEALN